MIELVHNPSGEVQLASAGSTVSGDQTEMTSVYLPYDNSVRSENENTIAKLKETIQSLQSQIEVRQIPHTQTLEISDPLPHPCTILVCVIIIIVL